MLNMKIRTTYLLILGITFLVAMLCVDCKQGGGKPVGDYETLIEIEDTVIKVNGRAVDVDAPIDTWLTYFEGKVDTVYRINGFTQAFRCGELEIGSDLHEQPWPIGPKSRNGRFAGMQVFLNQSEVGYQYPDTGQYRKVRVVYNGFDLSNDFQNMEQLNKYLRTHRRMIFHQPSYSVRQWNLSYPLTRFSDLYSFHSMQFKMSINLSKSENIRYWEISMQRLAKE
jgi:hypothetical protein